MRIRTGLLAALALTAGCRSASPSQVVCSNDDQCVIDGVFGQCEAVGFCSVPSDDCDSGKKFAGSGSCVPQDTGGDELGDGDGSMTTSDEGSEGEQDETGELPDPDMGMQCGQAIGSCDKLDVLVVVDTSFSMLEDAESVLPLFDFDVLELIAGEPCDLHMGVVGNDPNVPWQPESCQIRGALSSSGALNNGEPCYGEGNPPYVTSDQDPGLIGCAVVVDGALSSDEKQLDTLLAALAPGINEPGACNDGFFRPDAALIVLLITDEDDDDDSENPEEDPNRTGSAMDPDDWFDALRSIKDPKHIGIVEIMHTGEASCPWMPMPGNSDGTGGEVAANILLFNAYFTALGLQDHILALDICSEPSELLEQTESRLPDLLSTVCADSGL